MAVAGTEADLPFDTVIVAISEEADAESFANGSWHNLGIRKNGTLETDPASLMTNRPGVFAGGDLVTGPNTVIDAIADGKRVAQMIDRWLRGEELVRQGEVRLPEAYVEPSLLSEEELAEADRVEMPALSAATRHRSFDEVELTLSLEDATREAKRCLRCDLEFTQPEEETAASPAVAEETT